MKRGAREIKEEMRAYTVTSASQWKKYNSMVPQYQIQVKWV